MHVKNISFIYPCHNEEQAIPICLPKILKTKQKFLAESLLESFEIIVVNDGSTDSSQKLLEKHKEDIKIVSLETCKGYGYAIKEGVRRSTKEWVAFCDLDDTCDPDDLKKLIKATQEKSAPIVWGNRLHKKSKMPFVRKLGNHMFRYAIYSLSFVSVPDPCSGFRLFQKDRFKDILKTFPDGLNFSIALTAYCVRYKIKFHCVNVGYKERIGASKLISLKDGFLFLRALLRIFLK